MAIQTKTRTADDIAEDLLAEAKRLIQYAEMLISLCEVLKTTQESRQ
jgi:hypothetical protein